MAVNNTLNFLPEVFRSTTNQRFFGATMDQLATDAYNVSINGYIGRTFAPTYKSGDNYIGESSTARSVYQLESSVVIKDVNGNVIENSTYIDLLQSIANNGGLNHNQQRLFLSTYYNYDGHFDYDKFVNYNNYYWIPGGPDPVVITSAATPYLSNYVVTRNSAVQGYTISEYGGQPNPQITLARGGTYTFKVDQPGFRFWIQSEPGVAGADINVPEISTRSVFGVVNNGADDGTVTFNVPLSNAQNFYTTLPVQATVNSVATFKYTDIQNQLLSTFLTNFPTGFDGITTQLQGKTFVFISNQIDASYWTTPNLPNGYSIPDNTQIQPGKVITGATRTNVWQINLVSTGTGDYVIQIQPTTSVAPLQKVFIGSGLVYASQQFWLNNNYQYTVVPLITAPSDYLYYQDSTNPDFFGIIKLVDNVATPINATTDIIEKTNYTSPNGVVFTNGLKVEFDALVVPSFYASNQYYVEGVGTSIQLVPVLQLTIPEPYTSTLQTSADYITINRASQDQNPWTRSNCWFHIDVLTATAKYNGTTLNYGPNIPGRRAIIEFEPNLQLFNFGRQAKNNIDLITFDSTDAFVNIEGQITYTLDGTVLKQGMRVIFANDYDPNVKQQIWQVDYELINSQNYLRLIETVDDPIVANQNVLVTQGTNAGTTWYYDGANWHECQAKTQLNQAPLFDLVDADGYSFGDTSAYPASTFAGTRFFGYAVGTGANDLVLGFPLSYQNFNNIGDIVFNNYYDTDTFSYVENYTTQTANCNTGYLAVNKDLNTPTLTNNWIKGKEPTQQYQIITKIYDGYVLPVNGVNYAFVQIDITPATSKTIPYTKVYLNNKLLTVDTDYQITSYTSYQVLLLTNTPNIGDKIDILIFSSSISALGYYEIPENLDYNPLNQTFDSITLGQLRNHYNKLIENTALGSDSPIPYQDRYIKAQGGTLLQHSSPLIYGMTFLIDPVVNFVNGINLARKEYQRFKNKFLTLCTTLTGLDYKNPASGVDSILKSINSVKNSSFPWYYSDMVAQGSNYTTTTYTVLNARQNKYEIASIFNVTELSNRAVMVYHNGTLLVANGVDYSYDSLSPAVILNIALTVGDTIVIRDYANTDGNYVPETPTKLGLAQSYPPSIYVDATYLEPTTVILGHDGSKTPAFGDFRDQFLLELERRIYNNLKVDYNSRNILDVYNTVPGRFRTTNYSLLEWNKLVCQNFLQWVGNNNIDYTTNSWYDANNPWTWNYNQMVDTVDGSPLQGSWRAIYNYWFDTDQPHLSPWNMLGFAEQPTWWTQRYGSAPYTSGNGVLWQDLEAGYVWNNGDSYTDANFARLGLSNFIPVDSAGNLLPPTEIGIVLNVNVASGNNNYQIGEQGPVESAWRRSSDYPYAVQFALSLARPAEYFATQIDLSRFYINAVTGQFSTADNQKISPNLLTVNGDTVSKPGTVLRTAGYLNWIADSIKNLGIDPVTKIESYFSNFSVELAYRVAGFTDQNLITVTAEQTSPGSTNSSVIIPNENYSAYIGTPIPAAIIVYSGVIVTRSATGYVITGYDTTNPFFNIYASIANANSTTVTVNNLSVKLYQTGSGTVTTIPYGTTFATAQQVADFLISYQRYLISRGFVFAEFDTDLQAVRDWSLSVKEFLYWAQQGWAPGTIIMLNPIANQLNVAVPGGVINQVTNLPTGSRILDVNFRPIKSNSFDILRVDSPLNPPGNRFQLSVIDGVSTIAFAQLEIVQYETTLIFDNVDNFGDIIYVPEQGTRQYRLKLSGSKTGYWDGGYSMSGYMYSNPNIQQWQPGTDYRQGDIVIYNNLYYTAPIDITASQNFALTNWTQIAQTDIQTGLLPSFGHNAQQFINFYDVDNPPVDQSFQLFSAGLIGFRERPFLSNLSIGVATQTKFYQGYVKQKGTVNAVNALTKASFDVVTGNVNTYEEWAFRVGTYGDVRNNTFVEFTLNQSLFLNNPVALTFTANSYSTSANTIIDLSLANVYNSSNLSSTVTNIYYNRSEQEYATDLPYPGYVNLNDIDYQIFDITQNPSLPKAYVGNKVWVAKDLSGHWNVFRVTEVVNVTATDLKYTLDSYAQLTFNNPSGLSVNDFFILSNFNSAFDGVYRVIAAPNNLTVTIQLTAAQTALLISTNLKLIGTGIIYKLVSAVIDTITEIDTIRPPHDWIENDRVWVNSATELGWGVYTYKAPWYSNTAIKVSANTVTANTQFGAATAISSDEKFLYVGNPGSRSVQVFANVDYLYSANATISNAAAGFGSSVDTQHNIVVVGAPSAGNVHIYQHSNGVYTPLQTLTGTGSNQFGTSISLSGDAHWLYVGEPGDNNVYAYWTANTVANVNYTLVTGIAGSGGAFGSVVKTNATGNVVYVGAPNATNTDSNNGNVYIYTQLANAFSSLQTLSSRYKNNNAGFGSSLAIDTTGGNLFIGIPGSTASGYINGLVEYYTFNGTNYVYTANIAHPDNSAGSFGSAVGVSSDSQVLAVGSTGSSTLENTTFDNNQLSIDLGATKFIENVFNTGAVYLFELIADEQYTYTQELSESIESGDQFGTSVSVTRDIIVAGAPGTNNAAGAAYIYSDPNKNTAWQLTRYQQPKVDLSSINRIFIYNQSNNVILSALDYIDPAKGKILNAVGVDIDYQLTQDPAFYNAGTGTTHRDFHWGPAQVGKIWWDVSSLRYIDYEQDTVAYRLANWGTLFPGSQIRVYEWVESPVLPSQYTTQVKDGTPLHADDSAYSTSGYVTESGIVKLSYYFWVVNKTSVNTNAGKSNSVYSISAAIENPQSQGITYATVLRDDSLALYNSNQYLTGKNSILYLGTTSPSSNLIHSEYALVQENNPKSTIPSIIESKLIDSLCGQDRAGNPVPDPALTAAQAYGIQIRPRQSIFINPELALSNYITYVNSILISYPVVENKIMTTLTSSQPVPNPKSGEYSQIVNTYLELSYVDTTGLPNAYKVLVNNDATQSGKWTIYSWNTTTSSWTLNTVQSFKTDLYWSYTDWYQPGYDYTVAPDVTVANNYEYGQLTLKTNTYIKVLNNGNNQFVVYYIDNNLKQNLYGIQNGTVQFTTNPIPPLELRQLALAVQNDIFVDDLAANYNTLFFIMIKYALTEQQNLDWVFKTSFISASQRIRALEQFPAYVADNQQYYLDYINEVKPYRTTVRQFVVDYQGNDQYSGDTTDFDLAPYWDANLGIYRSPNGSQTYDANLLSTANSVYSQWYNNYTYQVVDIVITNPGTGFLFAPQVTITGGGGTGATASATITPEGGIDRISIISPGQGFTTTPTVIINGTGTGATGYAVLENVYDGDNTGHNLIRSLRTTIKFDRVDYTAANTFVFWNTVTTANIGETIPASTIIVNNNNLYVLKTNYTIDSALDFPIGNVSAISYSDLNNANDRIIAFSGNIDLGLTQTGIDYPGVIVDGNTYVGTEFDSQLSSYYGNVFGVNPGDITVDGGAYVSTFSSHAPEELVPGIMNDSMNFTVYDTNALAFRIFDNMQGNIQYTRIASANITTLSANLYKTDTAIQVTNAAALPLPNLATRTPGIVFINGEKIVYWRNYALETPTNWAANLVVGINTLINYSSNLYITTGNIYDVGGTFANVAANLTAVKANTIAQIRRGVDGTSVPNVQIAGSRVVDASMRQIIPNSYSTTTTVSVPTSYQTVSAVTYSLSFTSNITANIGDALSQELVVPTWTANTVVPINTYISYSGNSYTVTGNVHGSSFSSILGNLTFAFTGNIETTLSMYILQSVANSTVVAAYITGGAVTVLPSVFDGNLGLDPAVYAGGGSVTTIVANSTPYIQYGTVNTSSYLPAYPLPATSMINGNRYIINTVGTTQWGNVTILAPNQSAVPGLEFVANTVGASITGNGTVTIPTGSAYHALDTDHVWVFFEGNSSYVDLGVIESTETFDNVSSPIYINGVEQSSYIKTVSITGEITNTGIVTVPAGTVLEQSRIWYSPGAGTPSNGLPLKYSTTPQATFLDASLGFTPAPGTTP